MPRMTGRLSPVHTVPLAKLTGIGLSETLGKKFNPFCMVRHGQPLFDLGMGLALFVENVAGPL